VPEQDTSAVRDARLTAEQLCQMAIAAGAIAAKVISPSTAETAEWVWWRCRYGCGSWGSSLVCPPNSPTSLQTRALLDSFSRAILFESSPNGAKHIAVAVEHELYRAGCYKAFGLGAGPCHLCNACALEAGCRHPDQARPAMEACGIDVYSTVRKHGFTLDVIRGPRDEQNSFGLVLVD